MFRSLKKGIKASTARLRIVGSDLNDTLLFCRRGKSLDGLGKCKTRKQDMPTEIESEDRLCGCVVL